MSEQSPKRGRKKGTKPVVITNVRMTKETHQRLKALTDELGVETMSDAIDFIILEHYPQVEQRLRTSEARRKKLDDLRDKAN